MHRKSQSMSIARPSTNDARLNNNNKKQTLCKFWFGLHNTNGDSSLPQKQPHCKFQDKCSFSHGPTMDRFYQHQPERWRLKTPPPENAATTVAVATVDDVADTKKEITCSRCDNSVGGHTEADHLYCTACRVYGHQRVSHCTRCGKFGHHEHDHLCDRCNELGHKTTDVHCVDRKECNVFQHAAGQHCTRCTNVSCPGKAGLYWCTVEGCDGCDDDHPDDLHTTETHQCFLCGADDHTPIDNETPSANCIQHLTSHIKQLRADLIAVKKCQSKQTNRVDKIAQKLSGSIESSDED